MINLIDVLSRFIDLFIWLIIFRCILTFFPAIDWNSQPWQAIRNATDPILEPFRQLIPPMAGMDFSPLILFFLLRFIQQLLHGLV